MILQLIWELAEYEKLSDQAQADETTLRRELFEKKHAYALIAEQDGIPVGFALYFFNFSTFVGRAGLYLEDLYVRPQARGKGLGKMLFTRLAQIAEEHECQRMEWACLDWNAPSIAFYKSLGAVPMEDWTI